MKSLIVVFGALLLLISLPLIFTALDDAQTESTTDSFALLPLGSGNATVILGQETYNDVVGSVTSITSNRTGDSPSALTYNSGSRALVVTGLGDTGNRTLTVNYKIDSTGLPSGAAVFLTVMRWFWIFAILGFLGGAVYAFFD